MNDSRVTSVPQSGTDSRDEPSTADLIVLVILLGFTLGAIVGLWWFRWRHEF